MNQAMIKHIAADLYHRFPPGQLDFDDLLQDGYVGALNAESRYTCKHGASVDTFSKYRIRGEMMDGIRRSYPSRRHRDVRLVRHYDTADNVSVTDTVYAMECMERVDSLPQPLRDAMVLYILGHKQAEIGRLFGVSESRICQRLKEASKILKKRLCPFP